MVRMHIASALVVSTAAILGLATGPSATPAPTTDEVPPPRMSVIPGGDFPRGMTKDQLREFVDVMLGKKRKPKPLMERSLVRSKRKQNINVPTFYMDQFEVTNIEYKMFLDATNRPAPPHWEEGQIAEGEENLPITNVSMRDAEAYARWAGKRLPTEDEWEKAARGTDGRWFPWGNEWNDRGFCNNALQPPPKTTPPGQFEQGASPYQIFDMAGNVWEWTTTYIVPYPGNDNHPSFNSARGNVIRGACYLNTTHELAAFIRNAAPPENRFEAVGFRCARSENTGVDVTYYCLNNVITGQLPAGSGIDPTKAVGIEYVKRQDSTGYIESASSFAIAPVGVMNFNSRDALDKEAKSNKVDGSAVLGILTTDIACAEPALDAGDYAILYQKGDARAAKKEENADKDKKEGEEGTVDRAFRRSGYDRIVFLDTEGQVAAEIKSPKFETVTGETRSIKIVKELPPIGSTVTQAGKNVNGVVTRMVVDPKFGSKSLMFEITFKIPNVDLSGWSN